MNRRLSQNGSSSGTDPGDQQHHGPDSNTTADPSDIAALLYTTATTPIGMTMATLTFAASISDAPNTANNSNGSASTGITDGSHDAANNSNG